MKKITWIIGIVSISLLSLLLINDPLFLSRNSLIYTIYPLLMIGLFFLAYKYQPKIDKHIKNNQLHLNNMDVVKFICAITVLIMHLRPFIQINPILDIFFNNMISRICVPFFFVSSGFMAAIKCKKEPTYINRYIKATLKTYLWVSLIYLPLGIAYLSPALPIIHQAILSYQFNPLINSLIWLCIIIVALFIALIYVGTYYHLWYFPALLISLWILNKIKDKWNLSICLAFTFILLVIGSFETYYGQLPPIIHWFMDKYFMVFITTRNFLFFGLFYVILGYLIGLGKPKFAYHCLLGLALSTLGLIIEVVFLQSIIRKDSNILLSAPFFVYFLFITTIYANNWHVNPFNYRGYSTHYYLWHPLIIFIMYDILKLNTTLANESYILVFIALAFTHLLSYIILVKKKN